MPFVLVPWWPDSDAANLPGFVTDALQDHMQSFWFEVEQPHYHTGDRKWLFYTSSRCCPPGTEVIGYMRDRLSYGVSFSKVPQCMRDKSSTAADADFVGHTLGFDDLNDEDAFDLLNALIECASALLRTQHDSSRCRYRRANHLRRECISRLESIRNRHTPSLNVFRGRMISADQFLAEHATVSQSWESSHSFFASTDAKHLTDLSLLDAHSDMSTNVALDALRHNLRSRLSCAVASGKIIGVHHGFLQRGEKKTYVYIPGGQIDASDYDCQTFKHCVIWLMRTSLYDKKIAQGGRLDGGSLFLCVGTSLNLTRLTILPDGSHLMAADENSAPVVCIIARDVHEYIFTYECFKQASLSAWSHSQQGTPPFANANVVLREFLGLAIEDPLSRPSGTATFSYHGQRDSVLMAKLTEKQRKIVETIFEKDMTILDCIAGAGKTTIMLAALDSIQMEGDDYILVTAPNKPMVARLAELLNDNLDDTKRAVRGGIDWDGDHPVDLIAAHLDREAMQACISEFETLQVGRSAIDYETSNCVGCMNKQHMDGYWLHWENVRKLHAAYQIYLFHEVYHRAQEARKEAVGKINIIVATTSYARKLLGGEATWSPSFLRRRLIRVFVDEVHQESYLALSALLAHAPHAVLIGDVKQALLRDEDAGGTYTGAFSWIQRKNLPVSTLTESFRLGPVVTQCLVDTGDYAAACSHASAPDTTLLPVMFAPIEDAWFVDAEIITSPFMLQHMIHLIALEALSSVLARKPLSLAVICWYNVQKDFMEQYLVDLSRDHARAILQLHWFDPSFRTKYGGNIEDYMAAVDEGLDSVKVFLPGSIGGSEYSVTMLFLPRRRHQDATYRGTQLLSPAWRYVAITRGSSRSYIFIEVLSEPVPHRTEQAARVGLLSRFTDVCRNELARLRAPWYDLLQNSVRWRHSPPQIVFTDYYVEKVFNMGEEQHSNCLQHLNQVLDRMHFDLPGHRDAGNTFQDLLQDEGNSNLQNLLTNAKNVRPRCNNLPDLQTQYPVGLDVENFHDRNMPDFTDIMLDAICVNVLMDQITVSLPLLLYSPAWSLHLDPSDVAYELFQLFYIDLPVDIRQNHAPHTTRHKKKEVDVAGEIFLEEQCHSNRPAFCLLEHGCDEVFHLYSAMGLAHQHDDVRILLARCKSGTIALLWLRFLTEQYGLTLSEAQLQGDESAMIKWDWFFSMLRWEVHFDTPYMPFKDLLHEMNHIYYQ